FSIFISLPQPAAPPPSPSLPAQISVSPPWHALPLSQSDLGLLFSNTTPFACSQSLLMVPPTGARSTPGVQASFGPYFTSQSPAGPSVLHQVACFSLDGLEGSFRVAMTVAVHWWVEYSGRNSPLPPHGGVVSTFSFTDREIVGIAPITESSTIINTAILNSQRVSIPVLVLAVGPEGKVSDVTAAVTCRSANEDIVKVSSDCSTLFVDGSESGVGSACVGVEFRLGRLGGGQCVSVWVPALPLRVSLSDPVLSPIQGWSQLAQGRCSPVYQRSAVQVLAQFTAQSVETGQLTYMLGSPDWFMDVTELVRDWLKVEHPMVAELDEQTYLIGLQPGVTSLQVISNQWDGVLGSCDVTVTADHVTAGDLSVQLVGGLSLSVTANPAHPSIVTATAMAHNILYSYGQEASFSVWLQFSDETATLVSAFEPAPFSLQLSSLAETVVAVTPGPTQRVVAQGDGGGPLLRAELLVSTCQPMTDSAQKQAANERAGGGGSGGTKTLARGSGWVRVNVDWELHPEGGEEPWFEVLEMSDLSERELYELTTSSGLDREEEEDEDAYGGRNHSLRSPLERAVLRPGRNGGGGFSPPSREGGGGGDGELQVGAGTLLSLLCFSTLLFLANFLPCALRGRGRLLVAKLHTGPISPGPGFQGRVESVCEEQPGNYSLVLSPVVYDDLGLYECQDKDGSILSDVKLHISDFEKAFDYVDGEMLWKLMAHWGQHGSGSKSSHLAVNKLQTFINRH
ncbi:transmembrane protein 132B-like, partial [Conger conger]|uniref:transmembrane protein 132B-like n=1 Tax=Conger conger TaxID=82655 RepID=UPI002A5A3EA9